MHFAPNGAISNTMPLQFISSDSRRKRTKEDCYPPYIGALILGQAKRQSRADYGGRPPSSKLWYGSLACALRVRHVLLYWRIALFGGSTISNTMLKHLGVCRAAGG